MGHDVYRVVPRYSFLLFLAKIYGSTLGLLEMSTQLMQPTVKSGTGAHLG